ncbi:MAG: OmpA family protein [Lewinellaceae bacterium]|nr:OmpA family protein [Lewinellaceae bacterium]
MRRLILFIALAGIMGKADAQPLNRATYATMIKIAEQKMAEEDYYNALDWYEKAYDEVKDNETSVKIANLYFFLRDYRNAERAFLRVLRRDRKNEYGEERFTYAQTLKMNGKYDDAIEEFEKYISDGKDPVKKELAQVELEGAKFAKIAPDPRNMTISNAGQNVNSAYSEYSAVLAPDGQKMYYGSFNSEELIVVDKNNTDYFAKIFVSDRTDSGWGEGTALDEKINRPGYHNSNVTLSPDGRRMYFTRQLLTGNVVSESKIYLSEFGPGGWSPANEVEGVNGDYIADHPAVGELYGTEVLFFTSDKDGGYGGFDIYYSPFKGGKYGEPVNLGPKINTVGDEFTPYYRDGVLYFSSTGHPGLGGFDIFSSEWNGAVWSEPVNMGKGYNSSVDDLYFMLSADGYSGFLLSNRPGTRYVKSKGKTCCNDIYNVSLKVILADLKSTVFDQETDEELDGATLQLIDMTDDEENGKVVDTKTNGQANLFEFPLELDKFYRIIADREDYYPDTLEFNTMGLLDSKTYEIPVKLKPTPVYITISKEEPIELENIYYDFDDDKILPDAEPDLNFVLSILNEYPDMVIELSSHTDSRGNDAYNRDLSQRRAESARRWLLDKGVDRKRIRAVGYGETVPKTIGEKLAAEYPFLHVGDVLTEDFINKLPTEEEQEAAHQINRRTEFKIVEGPTSIKIEETRLIRKGAKVIEEGLQEGEGDGSSGDEKKN